MAEPDDAPLATIGWREWVAFPELKIARVKAKIDTGARTSAIHAYNVKRFARDGRDFVRFEIHPRQGTAKGAVVCEAELLEHRLVRSSSGVQTRRPVIITHVALLGRLWPIELTLANRDDMGFRLLLGRQALRGKFVVNPQRSYLGGTLKRKKS